MPTSDARGRPTMVYSLALPMENILAAIGEEKRNEAGRTLQLTQQLHEFAGQTRRAPDIIS